MHLKCNKIYRASNSVICNSQLGQVSKGTNKFKICKRKSPQKKFMFL